MSVVPGRGAKYCGRRAERMVQHALEAGRGHASLRPCSRNGHGARHFLMKPLCRRRSTTAPPALHKTLCSGRLFETPGTALPFPRGSTSPKRRSFVAYQQEIAPVTEGASIWICDVSIGSGTANCRPLLRPASIFNCSLNSFHALRNSERCGLRALGRMFRHQARLSWRRSSISPAIRPSCRPMSWSNLKCPPQSCCAFHRQCGLASASDVSPESRNFMRTPAVAAVVE